MLVLHTCDVPRCVNPKHLFLGTQTENMSDRDVKLRLCHGEKSPKAKLSEVDVLKIIDMYNSRSGTCRSIAKVYGVSQTSIWYIIKGRNWKRIHRPTNPT